MPLLALIERDFPSLVQLGYVQTSEATAAYNCVAFTLGDQTRSWWPTVYTDDIASYWPAGAIRKETVGAFVQMYAQFGFEPCAASDVEINYITVALYAEPQEDLFAHAAVQLASGRWISKMGDREDIMHTLDGLTGAPLHYYCAQILRCRSDLAPVELKKMLLQYHTAT